VRKDISSSQNVRLSLAPSSQGMTAKWRDSTVCIGPKHASVILARAREGLHVDPREVAEAEQVLGVSRTQLHEGPTTKGRFDSFRDAQKRALMK